MEIARRAFVLWIAAALPSLGHQAVQRGDFDLALDCLETYLVADPDSAGVHVLLGWVHVQKGDRGRALDNLNAAVRLTPNSCEAYRIRGAVLAEMGQMDKAAADFTQALRLKPRDVHAYRLRGTLYAETKEYAKAANDYESLLRLNPNDTSGRLALVDLLATAPDETVRDLPRADEEAGRLDPHATGSPRAFVTLAAAHARRGELDSAISWQRRALACAERLNKEEKRRTALVLQLYRKRKKEADKAAARQGSK